MTEVMVVLMMMMIYNEVYLKIMLKNLNYIQNFKP